MVEFFYKVILFYTVVAVLLSLAGLQSGSNIDEIPSYPEVSIIKDIPLVGTILNMISMFVPYIILIMYFIVKMSVFTIDLLPSWLNVILFTPLGLALVYEVTTRLGRGSGG